MLCKVLMNDIVVYGFCKICSDRDLEISCRNKNFSDGKVLSKSGGNLVLTREVKIFSNAVNVWNHMGLNVWMFETTWVLNTLLISSVGKKSTRSTMRKEKMPIKDSSQIRQACLSQYLSNSTKITKNTISNFYHICRTIDLAKYL